VAGQVDAGIGNELTVGRVETLPSVIGEQGARPPQPPLLNLPGSPPGHVADLALNASPYVIPAPNAGLAASTGALDHGNPSGWNATSLESRNARSHPASVIGPATSPHPHQDVIQAHPVDGHHLAPVPPFTGGFVDEQVIRGCYFGSAHLQRDVPALTGHYLAGDLLLDELITRRIGLDELNDAFDALRGGKGARSVLVLD
jgi:hypothetical protein